MFPLAFLAAFTSFVFGTDFWPGKQKGLICPQRSVLTGVQFGNSQAQLALSPWMIPPSPSWEDLLNLQPKSGQAIWFHLPADLVAEVRWQSAVEGDRIHSWWFATQQSTGVILFCHGNAANLSHFFCRDETVQVFDPGYYAVPDVAFEPSTPTKKFPPEKADLFGETFASGAMATELTMRRLERTVFFVRTYSSLPAVMTFAPLASKPFNQQPPWQNTSKLGAFFPLPGDWKKISLSQEKPAAPESQKPTVTKNCDNTDCWPGDFLQVLSAFLPAIEEETPRSQFNFWVSMFR